MGGGGGGAYNILTKSPNTSDCYCSPKSENLTSGSAWGAVSNGEGPNNGQPELFSRLQAISSGSEATD